MAKELYLYSPIYDFVAEELITAMETNKSEDITLRLNTPGGSVLAGWGIIAKMQEHKMKVNIKLDGAAMSMGAVILAYADNVEALDVSTVMLHRASMYVSTPEDQTYLDNVNKNLRAKLESKIDNDLLKAVTGYSIADLFESEKRIDLFLTAKQAKKIGLVDKINSVNPKEITAMNQRYFEVAAINTNNQTPNKMTLDQLKTEHPSVYAAAVAIGAEQEKDRVEACLTFIEADPKGVKEAISSGKPLSQKQMSEFALKVMSVNAVQNIQADSAAAVTTTEDKTGKEKDAKDVTAFVANVKNNSTLLK